MLHFRATPEEKQTIRENAGHAEVALSEWMRQQALKDEKRYAGYGKRCAEADMQDAPTQPVVPRSSREEAMGQALGPEITVVKPLDAKADPTAESLAEAFRTRGGETYEQFMERRVRELLGEGETEASMAFRDAANAAAETEWAQMQGDSSNA